MKVRIIQKRCLGMEVFEVLVSTGESFQFMSFQYAQACFNSLIRKHNAAKLKQGSVPV